jgi:hypothetical protein
MKDPAGEAARIVAIVENLSPWRRSVAEAALRRAVEGAA